MQRINFTQDTLNTLKRSARCSFANAVYKLTMKAQQGLKCDDLFKKSVLMNEVNKLLCKYKLDTCISFHPALEAGISSWYFGIGSFTGVITYNLIIEGVETFIGSGSSVENIVIDINNNTEGTGVTAVLGEGGYFTIYSPAGCFIKADLTGSKDPEGTIPATLTTFTKGKCPQEETCVEYTEEELNCITPQDLQLLFEFTHRYKETLAKSTKRITSPSTSSSSPSPSDCCNWGSIGGSIGNQSDLVAYLNTIKKNFIAASNESVLISNDIKSLNFLGAGVTATNSGGDISITIPGGGGGGSAYWGDIAGIITEQTDLITYLGDNYYPLVGNPSEFLYEVIANNGLTSTSVNVVKLGGTLVEDTTINQPDFLMNFTGTIPLKGDSLFNITTTDGLGGALNITSIKNALDINATTIGISINSSTSPILAIGTLNSSFGIIDTATSDVSLIQGFLKSNLLNAPSLKDSGLSLGFIPGIDSASSSVGSSLFSCLFENVTNGSVQTRFSFSPIGDGTSTFGSTLETFGSGKLKLNAYGINTFTGTPTYLLGVDANGDVVETTVSGGSQTLADTLALGNTSGANDIQFDATQGLLFDNGARLREGTIDAGLGGTKGVAQICAVGYELKWEAGRLYVMDGNGLFIRQSLYNFTTTPTVADDVTKGYMVGSLWTLDDGTTYICSDATATAAVWGLSYTNTPDLQQVLDGGNTSTTPIKIDDGAGNAFEMQSSVIKIINPLGGNGQISSQLLTATTTFELPNKPAGTQTFAMMSDITAGSGDVVGPASAVDNNIATFDGTTGKLIQDGGTTIADINTNAVDRITVKLAQSITKGQAVYISGANGTNILVSKSDNTTEATSSKTLGLLETTGATNAIVNVITSGLIDGINTSAATVGDAVWLGTAGNLLFGLANKPYAPAHLVYIGVVSRVSATVGEIIVKVQNGFELKEIHDVSAQTPANKNGLFYNTSTSLWEARAVAATDIDANVSNVEFSYLDGVTSAIQTQLAGKQTTLTNPVTGTGTNNEIAVFNSTGSTVTSLAVATYPSLTELSYVKGVTSAIQTQLNAIKKPISSVGNGTAVTGVVVNTYSKGLLIPANSRIANDVPLIECQVTKTGTAGNIQLRFYWNTTNDLSGSPILLGTSPNGAANWISMCRSLCIEVAAGGGNGTKVAPTTVVLATSWGTATAAPNALAIDWTANGYLICAILNSNAGDSSVCHMLKLN